MLITYRDLLGRAFGILRRTRDEGIRTGLNKMGEGFIIADTNSYPAHSPPVYWKWAPR